jgi:hypothetical protein
VKSSGKKSHAILQYSYLDDAEREHIVREFAKPEYVARVQSSRLTPAYGVLLTPVSVPPQTEHWQMVLRDLMDRLIKVVAYTGITPAQLDHLPREKLIARFDHTRVVEQVRIDFEEIQKKFLNDLKFVCRVEVRNI